MSQLKRLNELYEQLNNLQLELQDIIDDEVAAVGLPVVSPVGNEKSSVRILSARPLKLALIVGHTMKAPGAGNDGKWHDVKVPHEYHYHSGMVVELKQIYALDDRVQLFVIHRDAIGITGAYREADKQKVDCTIELHYNGSTNPDASGTMTLSSGSKSSMALCKHIQDRVVALLKLRDRGVVVRKRGERGGYNLAIGKAPAALVEPAFVTNEGDARLLLSQVYNLGAEYVEAAIEWWQKENKEN